MFQIRLHGRGGQGVVTAAELIALAAFEDGHEAQAFPSFGPERTGAPVIAYARVDDHPIRTHEPIAEPDAVLVCDASLLHHVDLFTGVAPGATVLLDSTRSPEELGLADLIGRGCRVTTLPAADTARRLVGRPLGNTCLLGALAAGTEAISIDALETALRQRFAGEVADANVAAARAGYAAVQAGASHA